RYLPQLGVGVYLPVRHAGNFAATLPGQQQQPDGVPERLPEFTACGPQPADFIIRQDAVAVALRDWGLDPVARGRRQSVVAALGPISPPRKRRQRAIDADTGAAIHQPVQFMDDIDLADISQLARPPPITETAGDDEQLLVVFGFGLESDQAGNLDPRAIFRPLI